MGWKRKVLILLWSAAVLVGADLGLSRVVLDDDLLFGRAIPPFGALPHPKHRKILATELEREPAFDQHRFDRELGWTLSPKVVVGDVVRQVNSIGARGSREYAPTAPQGTLRIAAYGDSFTYGMHVPHEAGWTAQLEAAHRQLEVVNLGVNGYGTDQALLRFRRTRERVRPHVVFIGMMLENIKRNVNRYRPLLYPETKSFLAKPRFRLEGGELELMPLPFTSRDELLAAVADGSVIERLSDGEYWADPRLPDLAWKSSFLRLGAAYARYSKRATRNMWANPEEEPTRLTIALLEAFHLEAEAAGAEWAPVLIFPPEPDLRDFVERGRRHWRGLLDELELRGIPFVDLSVALAEAFPASLDERGSTDLYNRHHLTERGNRIVSRVLGDRLADEGILPQASSPGG